MTALSEEHILQVLEKYFPNRHPSLVLGRGDDCSIVRTQGNMCVSTDLFMEDVHFRTSYFSPQDVGHKALAVNISDIAAMGARPTAFSLGLAFPPHTEIAWLEGLFEGMARLAQKHNLVLSGGDLSKANVLTLCITIWGESANTKNFGETTAPFLTRGGAMPGDILFIVGDIGLARIGLEELEKHGSKAKEQWPAACAAHLCPEPQTEAGLILARSSLQVRPPVLMDVSDGLSRDIPRLLGMSETQLSSTQSSSAQLLHEAPNTSNANSKAFHKSLHSSLGAQIVLPTALLHEEVLRHARMHDRCAAEQAWFGGEDYALLGACVPKLLPILHAALPKLRSIGTLTDRGYIELNGETITSCGGFDHFS